MDTIRLPPDFSDFLSLLNGHGVDFLIIGGYAVGFHGYPRATVDLDIWIRRNEGTAIKVVQALRDFGFGVPELRPELFLTPNKIVRLGAPPVRLELMTTIDGVEFEDCYFRRVEGKLGGVPVCFISLDDLKSNKKASGRPKDLADLEELP